MKTKLKFFLKFFIPIFILSTTVLSLLTWYEVKGQIETLKIREFSNVLLKVKSIENHLNPVIADLTFLISHHNLQDFLDNNSETTRQRLQDEFLLTSAIKTYYDQIRFINKAGMEVVRINYNNGSPVIVPEKWLQSKKDRYYFMETFNLDPGEIYASPFDLNVEGEKIEMPVKPMIRIGMPVFNHLMEKKGIVIINYLGELLLKEFAQNTILEDTVIISENYFWLINADGFWLKGPETEKEWTFMYDDKKELSFSSEYPLEWKTILSTNNGQIRGAQGLFTYSTIFPFSQGADTGDSRTSLNSIDNYRWKVISFIPNSILKGNIQKLLWKYIIILFLINISSLFGNLILVNDRLKIKESEENSKLRQKKRNSLQTLLLKIYQSEFQDLKTGLKEVVIAANEIMRVDYVSIWRMNKDNTYITCMDIPADSAIYPFTDMVIDFDRFPEYFEAVLLGNQIIADDALEHSVTKGFRDTYLIPEGVVSALDSPIWNHGKIMGILALAQRGERRKWTIEDQNFAMQLAASIATMIETDERIKAKQKMREAVEKAEDANRIKSEFLANMSHEIRTPMNAILGFSEILLDKKQNDEDREYLQSINSSGKTLLLLINDILDLSKIEADKVEIINKQVSILSIMDDMQRIFSRKVNEKKLNYITEISPTIEKIVSIDETRLRQILLNVIGNAVKFTDKGFIKISLNSQTSLKNTDSISLIIDIEDTGIGIPVESRDHVFDPFEQTGKGSLAKYGGTGLGLAITKRLLKLMNGNIEIIHKEDPGTIFRITFSKIKTGLPSSDKSLINE